MVTSERDVLVLVVQTCCAVSDKTRFSTKVKCDTASCTSGRLCPQLSCSYEHASHTGLFSNRMASAFNTLMLFATNVCVLGFLLVLAVSVF